MKPVTKISALLTLLCLFIVVLCFIYARNLPIQLIYFLGINFLFLFFKGAKTYWTLAKYWYRFSIFIIIIFLITWLLIHWMHISYHCAYLNFLCFKEWLFLGVGTALLLINTVFTVEWIILAITINDILALPLRIRYLKAFILARTLFLQTTARFDQNKLLLKTIPDFQPTYKRGFKNLKILFQKNILLVLTFVLYLDEQSEILGRMIDNRIKHTRKN